MLLTITTTHAPATDLGYLLHKHPARCHAFSLPFGKAHVFFPEAQAERCTAAMLLDVDPVGLVRSRGKGRGDGYVLRQYVNDRPYAASSFLSVAIARVYRTALSGRCKDRPELAETPLPLVAKLTAVPDASGGLLLQRLFEPLGYRLAFQRYGLDPHFPDWGDSDFFAVELEAEIRLSDLLAHLYVLVPVLDDHKHYWVGQQEAETLLRRGEGWLGTHPARELITRRYLKYQRALTQPVLERLMADDTLDVDGLEGTQAAEEAGLEKPLSLNQQRLDCVFAELKSAGARRVLDLGCGEGNLLRMLLGDPQFAQIVGLDVSYRALEMARQRLHLDRLAPKRRERLKLWHGSLVYRDARLRGFDAAAVVEVIEHLDPARLDLFERALFEHARPGMIVLTTPNAEYNANFEALPAGELRHRDHRFEWTRSEFEAWARRVAERFGYTVRFTPVGPEDPAVGAPGQMGVFSR
jgi:3' terminal RNA ribose 2'-O-methyltransferase Hen1